MNRKHLLIILFAFSSNFLLAQTQKGNTMLGGLGEIGLYDDFDEGYDRFSMRLDPNYAYFFKDRMSVGALLSVSYSSLNNDALDLSTLSGSLLPFYRYYYYQNERVGVFAQAAVGYGVISFKSDEASETEGLFSWRLSTGADFFLNEHVAFELGIGYNWQKISESDTDPSSSISLRLGIQAFLFGGKSE